MYLDLATVLIAWSILLSWPPLLGVSGFIMYLNIFQIGPEGRALANLCEKEFTRHCSEVGVGAKEVIVRFWPVATSANGSQESIAAICYCPATEP